MHLWQEWPCICNRVTCLGVLTSIFWNDVQTTIIHMGSDVIVTRLDSSYKWKIKSLKHGRCSSQMLGAEKTIAIHITKETDTAHGRRQMISKSVFLYSEFLCGSFKGHACSSFNIYINLSAVFWKLKTGDWRGIQYFFFQCLAAKNYLLTSWRRFTPTMLLNIFKLRNLAYFSLGWTFSFFSQLIIKRDDKYIYSRLVKNFSLRVYNY